MAAEPETTSEYRAVQLLQRWDSGFYSCRKTQRAPLNRVFALRRHQLRDWRRARTVSWSSANSGEVRISARLKVRRASSDLPHAPEQRSGGDKTPSYILTSASGRGCKTPATGAARPASQGVSPASCATLRPPLLLLITGPPSRAPSVWRAEAERRWWNRSAGDGASGARQAHGRAARRRPPPNSCASRILAAERRAGCTLQQEPGPACVRGSAGRGTILIVAGRDKRDVKGQAGTSRFLRRGLLLVRVFKGTARRTRLSERACQEEVGSRTRTRTQFPHVRRFGEVFYLPHCHHLGISVN